MCFGEMVDRRRFLASSLAAAAAATAAVGSPLAAAAADDEQDRNDKGPGAAGVKFTWFGTNGWEITFGKRTILIDPWFGRFDTGFHRGQVQSQHAAAPAA